MRPGVACSYSLGPDYSLQSIRVHAPSVFARNGRTSQVVGWRFRVMTFDGSWMEVDRVGFTKATATPRRNAPFGDRSISSAGLLGAGHVYVVLVDLRWYAGDGTTVTGGTSTRIYGKLVYDGGY